MSDPITINLTLSNVPNAARIAVEVNADDTPASLREKAAEASKIPIDSMRLIFRGRLVGKEDDKNAISEFKLEAGSVIHCMGKPAEAAVPAAAAVPTTAGSSVTVTGGAAAAPTSASDASAAPTLASALTTLRTSNPSATYLTGVTTLEKVLSNISKNPMEEKYRKVKRGNAAFNKRLGGLPGGEACMLAVGFSIENVDGTENYVMQASPDAWPKLMQHVAELGAASQAAKHAAAPPAGGVLPGAMPGMAGMPPMGAMPAAGGGLAGMPGMAALPGMAGMPSMGPGGMPQMTPQMQQAAAQMMQNPEQLQSMLQNPMVQNMLRNDPRFANNPQMQQSIEHMANNPQMMQQMSQMMQNPDLLNMMGGGGAQGGVGGAAPPQPGSGTNNDGRSDQDMTEEEMMEEAIRRSLNEN